MVELCNRGRQLAAKGYRKLTAIDLFANTFNSNETLQTFYNLNTFIYIRVNAIKGDGIREKIIEKRRILVVKEEKRRRKERERRALLESQYLNRNPPMGAFERGRRNPPMRAFERGRRNPPMGGFGRDISMFAVHLYFFLILLRIVSSQLPQCDIDCLFGKKDKKCDDCLDFGSVKNKKDYCSWGKDSMLEGSDQQKVFKCYIILKQICETSGSVRFHNRVKCLPFDESKYLHRYPPRESAITKIPGMQPADLENLACKMTKSSELYDRLLLCWLPDCAHRLTIPDPSKHKLCFPPILRKKSQWKFCPLDYSTRTSFYDYTNPKTASGCVLPPMCGTDGKVNSSTNVIPLVDGVLNETYCEKYCPTNITKGIVKGCRLRPTCGKPNGFMVDCLEWCDPETSLLLFPQSNGTLCNMRPLCLPNGQPPPVALNPFGANSTECVRKRNCTEQLSADKYNCILVVTTTQKTTDTEKPTVPLETSNVEYTMYILITAGGVILIVGITMIVCCGYSRHRKIVEKKRKKFERQKAKEEEEKRKEKEEDDKWKKEHQRQASPEESIKFPSHLLKYVASTTTAIEIGSKEDLERRKPKLKSDEKMVDSTPNTKKGKKGKKKNKKGSSSAESKKKKCLIM